MHTIWKGTISFGLVNIPIKLHAATEDKDIKLRSLHKKCHSPIQYEKICPVCGEEVEAGDIVKGYEITKGKFVVLEQDKLEDLRKTTEEKAVEIMDFIDMREIDPIYFNRSYYMSPERGRCQSIRFIAESADRIEKSRFGAYCHAFQRAAGGHPCI
ncbi:hypothetical protein BpJC7_23810 [Weizmannia acidilactici]|uniref:Ku domain-containing protein n=1 Tax=Weizmannia acidilactici TaxID=2607726 RepID=A0A5J4JKK8_9BACI|nr:hypothetical protein BpJC7_23810 [Weizmannia acidilactici]